MPTELNKDKFNNLLASGNVFSNEIEGVGKYLNNIKSFEEFTNILNSPVKAKSISKIRK